MSGVLHRLRFRSDHRWARQHMSDYLDGEGVSRTRLRIERHIGECDQCRRLLAELRGVVDGLHRLSFPSGGGEGARIAVAVRERLAEPPGAE